MKTYEIFVEATTGDLKSMGATPAQIATLKQRREKRGYGFDRGDDRVKKAKSDPLAKASGVKAPVAPTKASAATDPLKRAADKGSAIVRQKQGGTGKEAFGAPKKSGPGVGSTKSQYKTGPLAIRDKPGSLAKRDLSKPSEKQAGSRPGTTRDGWGVKPRGDFKSPGNAPHDGAKTISAYDKARKARDIENKLDKEDENKGKFKKFAKKALGATGKFVKNNSPKAGSVATSKAGSISGPQITDN